MEVLLPVISHRPYVIGIAGGTASGKTTMTNTIVRTVGPSRVVIIAYDSYYKDLSHVPLAERLLTTNFDHPDSLDTPLLAEHLRQLRRGEAVETPTYDFVSCTRLAATRLAITRWSTPYVPIRAGMRWPWCCAPIAMTRGWAGTLPALLRQRRSMTWASTTSGMRPPIPMAVIWCSRRGIQR